LQCTRGELMLVSRAPTELHPSVLLPLSTIQTPTPLPQLTAYRCPSILPPADATPPSRVRHLPGMVPTLPLANPPACDWTSLSHPPRSLHPAFATLPVSHLNLKANMLTRASHHPVTTFRAITPPTIPRPLKHWNLKNPATTMTN